MKIKKVLICLMLALLPNLLLAQPGGASGNWDLIFEENFNGNTLDTSKWSVNYPWGNGHRHNHEAWCVAEQVSVQNGMLRITATDQKHPDSEEGYDWTSGIITSAGKFHMDEGFLEGRFRMPPTLGTWAGAPPSEPRRLTSRRTRRRAPRSLPRSGSGRG